MTPEILYRILARHLDLLIAGALAVGVRELGPGLALAYTLLADGLPGGRSLGKRMAGLKVVRASGGAPCGYRESVLRNVDLAMGLLFAVTPFLGWFFAAGVGGAVYGYELFLLWSDEEGLRIGDLLAETRVVTAEPPRGGVTPGAPETRG